MYILLDEPQLDEIELDKVSIYIYLQIITILGRWCISFHPETVLYKNMMVYSTVSKPILW